MKNFIIVVLISITLICVIGLTKKNISDKNQINLLFNIDNNYAEFLMVELDSIYKHNQSNSHYNIFIIEDNISFINKIQLFLHAKLNFHDIHFKKVDLSVLNTKDLFFIDHITEISLAKLFAGSIIPQNIDKILYLDADIIAIKDIKEIYDIDLQGNIAGMRLDYWHEFKYQRPDNKYFNVGVMLIDLKKWREFDTEKKLVSFFQENHHDLSEEVQLYNFIEQDVINIILSKQIFDVNEKVLLYEIDCMFSYNENTVLIHYHSPTKPWTWIGILDKYPAPLQKYYEAWDKSPFKYLKKKYIEKNKKNIEKNTQ